MNRPYDPEAIARVHELARQRALQLRQEAMDAFFARGVAAVRRAFARLRPRPGFTPQVEA